MRDKNKHTQMLHRTTWRLCAAIAGLVSGVLTAQSQVPTITAQPTNQVVALGLEATFAVTATGTPSLSYQWWFNATNAITDATNEFLIFAEAQPAHAGAYTVIITNTFGAVTSAVAVLRVAAGTEEYLRLTTAILVKGQLTNATVNLPGILADGDLAAIDLGGYAVWRKPLTSFNYNHPHTVALAFPTNVTLVFALAADGRFYAGAEGPVPDVLAVAGSFYWGTESTTQGTMAPSTPNWQGTEGVVTPDNGLYEPRDLALAGMTQWALRQLQLKGHLTGLPGADSDFRYQTTLAVWHNLPKPLWLVYYPVWIGWGHGAWIQPYDLPLNHRWCQFANITNNGTVTRSVRLGYSGALGSYVFCTAQNDNGEQTWAALDGQEVVRQENYGHRIASFFDRYPTNLALGGTKTWSEITPSLTLSVLADSVSVSDWTENPSLGERRNPPPDLLMLPPGQWVDNQLQYKSQPQSQVVVAGSNATFSVEVAGSMPVSYQWYFNGTNALAGETNATLVLSNVQLAHAGCYVVVASNAYGSVTSNPAILLIQSTWVDDAAAAFSPVSNPKGTWSYGWSLPLGTNFTLFDDRGLYGYLKLEYWRRSIEGYPLLFHNQFPTNFTRDNLDLAAGGLSLHPGAQGEYAVVRWTSPAAGSASITGEFRGNNTVPAPSTDVHVLHNGGSLFTNIITQFGMVKSFAVEVDVGVGDTIDFAVGWGSNLNCGDDNTGLSATIALSSGTQAPVILSQPQSQSVFAGDPIDFMVTVFGSLPLSYQWWLNETNLVDDGRMSGTSACSLSISSAAFADTGAHSVVVSNAFGAVTSVVANLIVAQPLHVAQQGRGTIAINPDPATLNFGDPVTLTATPARWYALSHWLSNNVLLVGSTNLVVTIGLTNDYTAIFTNTVALEQLLPSHSAASDFSITNGNPNGVWSYGWMAPDFSSFHLYTNALLNVGDPLWSGGWNPDNTPMIWKVLGGPRSGVPTGWIGLHPGDGYQPSVLRWTSPVTGPVSIVGQFLPGDGGAMAVGVRLNNQPWWQAVDAGAFDLSTQVVAGCTIDFAVYGGYYSGNTPIEATIVFPYGEIPVGTPRIHVNGISANAQTNLVFTETNVAAITLQTSFTNGTIYYTLDGSTPTTNSTRYTAPFALTNASLFPTVTTLHAVAWSADFSQSVEADPVQITIIPRPLFLSTQGRGSVTKSPDQTSYALGQEVTLTATPARWYEFVGWSDGNTDNPRAITIGLTNRYSAIFTNTVPLELHISKEWEADYGGTGDDTLQCMQLTPDGGSLVGGYSVSGFSGNKGTTNCGGLDYWVLKLDAEGRKEWERNFGGDGDDYLLAVAVLADGSSLLAGSSFSGMSGNKTAASLGGADMWLVRLDSQGNRLWDRTYGGDGNDGAGCVALTSDGGFLVGGSSLNEAWFVKLNAEGDLQWSRTFPAAVTAVCETETHYWGFGYGVDAAELGTWSIRLDTDGNNPLPRFYPGAIEGIYEAVPRPAGGFVIAGIRSGNGQLLLTASDGSEVGRYSLGGGNYDTLISLTTLREGGFLAGGSSKSGAEQDKTTPNYGGYDAWWVWCDEQGQKRADFSIGGSSDDRLFAIRQLADGNWLVAINSESGISGLKRTANYGGSDYWIIKIRNVEVPVGTPRIHLEDQLANGTSNVFTETNAVPITLQTSFTNGMIYYTLDGLVPTTNSTRYTAPFVIANTGIYSNRTTLRAVAWNADFSHSVEADPVQITIIPRPLFLSTQGRGTITKSPDQTSYALGQEVTLTATPGRWYEFVRWSDGDINNPRSVTIGLTNRYLAIFTNTVPLEHWTWQMWDRSYGGIGEDRLVKVVPTADGGFLLAGTSDSPTNALKSSASFGGGDYWLVRINAAGEVLWDRSCGGTDIEDLSTVRLTCDGGFIVGGFSYSGASGNKTTSNHGLSDVWLVRLDAAGNMIWQASFGGASYESSSEILCTPDGGFVVAAAASSAYSGNKNSTGYGGYDYWIFKLDANGNKLWEQCYGGDGNDWVSALEPTADGGFLVSGFSLSTTSGNRTAPSWGAGDFWVVRLGSEGNRLWERAYGGSEDDNLTSATSTGDGGFLLAGASQSAANETKTSPYYGGAGYGDFWLIRIDANGDRLWDRTFGGAGDDGGFDLRAMGDGRLLFGGPSASVPGHTKTSPHYGDADFWILGLGRDGSQLFEHSAGGNEVDRLFSIELTADNHALLGGYSASEPGGTKTSPHYGSTDFWIVKLGIQEAPVGTPQVWINSQIVNGQTLAFAATGAVQVVLTSSVANSTIYYSLDGSDPYESVIEYTGPLWLTTNAVIRAITYDFDLFDYVTNRSDPVIVNFIPVYAVILDTNGAGSVQVTASWEPASGGSGVVSPGLYLSNTVVTLTGSPAPGWGWADWSGDTNGAAISNDTITVAMTQTRAITANFYPVPIYTLDASTPGGGTVEARVVSGQWGGPAPKQYYSNAVISLTASNLPGWQFLGWSGALSGSVNPQAVTLNSDLTVGAVFGTTLIVATNAANLGAVTLDPLLGVYPYGTALHLMGVPAAGKFFNYWSNNLGGVPWLVTNSPIRYVVTNANPTFMAYFGGLPGGRYALTALVTGDGEAVRAPQANFYTSGQSVTVTAQPNPGWTFANWSGDTNGATIVNGTNLTVTMNPSKTVTANFVSPPVITNQPQGALVTAGTNYTLSVGAEGADPLAYQWRRFGLPIAGATNATLPLINIQLADLGDFTVVVSNHFGAVTSAVATVTFPGVTPALPSITAQPQSQTVPALSNVVLSVTATGTEPLSYQWTYNGTNAIPAATNTTLTLANVQPAQAGDYRVIVTNTYGAITSLVAVLTVEGGGAAPAVELTSPAPAAIFTAPANLPLTALAADADGMVVRVEFYANSILLGAVTNSQPSTNNAQLFSAIWTNAPVGSHALLVRAVDDSGLTATSAPVNITVQTALPQVTLAHPLDGAVFTLPGALAVESAVFDADGSVARVEFYAQTGDAPAALLAAITNAPYAFAWTNPPIGVHQLTARAVDFFGPTVTSAPVAIAVATAPPEVAITAPPNGAAFVLPTNMLISAVASDVDDSLARVDFYAQLSSTNSQPALLGSVTNVPFRLTWANPPAGAYVLAAVAVDQFGPSVTSAPVNVTVTTTLTNTPVFWLASSAVTVNETAGVAAITVLKNANSPAATVDYQTTDGSAVGGVDFTRVSGFLSFNSGQTSAVVNIPITDDLLYEGDESCTFALFNPSPGAALGSPVSAAITIHDREDFADGSFPVMRTPTQPSAHANSLRVRLEPPEASGQWRLEGELSWRAANTEARQLVSGNYRVEFKPVSGYLQPAAASVPVEGATDIAAFYAPFTSPQLGWLTVFIKPDAVAAEPNADARGMWRIEGESAWRNSGDTATNLSAGAYVVEFKAAQGRVTPANLLATVVGDQGSSVAGTYLLADSFGASTPNVIQFATIQQSPAFGLPHAFAGQIRTELGYGSGAVIKEKLVLTAAHVILNDGTFSYVTNVQWLFQRDAGPLGSYEPCPQVPRGFYVLSGYAAQRQAENTPGQSSPTAQNLDVAVLYFNEPAGRGGYGGYLVSDATNAWLQAPELKMLVGYPMDAVIGDNRGRLHATAPGIVNFAPVLGQVYGTSDIKSYGGNSGGPLCVRYRDGKYYPAGVYLGGTAQTIVRAVDAQVVELIRRGEVSSNGGTNATGGGVTWLGVPAGLAGVPIGYLRVNLAPAGAVSAGAQWRVAGYTNQFMADATVAIIATTYTIEFTSVSDYTAPASRSVTVVSGQTNTITASYTPLAGYLQVNLSPSYAVSAGARWQVVGEGGWMTSGQVGAYVPGARTVEFLTLPYFAKPAARGVAVWSGQTSRLDVLYLPEARLSLDRELGLFMVGPSGATYRIEYAPALNGVAGWSNLTTLPLGPGPNWVPETRPTNGVRRFYRGVWEQ